MAPRIFFVELRHLDDLKFTLMVNVIFNIGCSIVIKNILLPKLPQLLVVIVNI